MKIKKKCHHIVSGGQCNRLPAVGEQSARSRLSPTDIRFIQGPISGTKCKIPEPRRQRKPQHRSGEQMDRGLH